MPPIISFVRLSGTGKTTFLEKLIPVLKARGLRLALIKHDAHHFVSFYVILEEAGHHLLCRVRFEHDQHGPALTDRGAVPLDILLPQHSRRIADHDVEGAGDEENDTGVFVAGLDREHVGRRQTKDDDAVCDRLVQFYREVSL